MVHKDDPEIIKARQKHGDKVMLIQRNPPGVNFEFQVHDFSREGNTLICAALVSIAVAVDMQRMPVGKMISCRALDNDDIAKLWTTAGRSGAVQ